VLGFVVVQHAVAVGAGARQVFVVAAAAAGEGWWAAWRMLLVLLVLGFKMLSRRWGKGFAAADGRHEGAQRTELVTAVEQGLHSFAVALGRHGGGRSGLARNKATGMQANGENKTARRGATSGS
jgi:hypothetical protein